MQNWIDLLNYNETDAFDAIMSSETSTSLNDHLITPSFLKHSIIFISVIVGSFLILIFLISLIIVDYFYSNKNEI